MKSRTNRPSCKIVFLFAAICASSMGFQTALAVPAYQSSSVDEQNRQVKSIYESTKTAKTAQDYTSILASCESTLSGSLSSKNRNYLTSLCGWALNRRGQLRLETAQQLEQVGNTQSEKAFDHAMSDFDAAIEADRRRWRSWQSRGIAFASRHQFDSAVDDFSRVIEMQPDRINGWFNRAECNYHRADFEAALSDYNKVLNIDAADLQGLTGRGHARTALGKLEEALSDHQAVNSFQPDNCQTLINLGDVFQRLQRWQSADEQFVRAAEIDRSKLSLQRLAWFKATCPDEQYRDANQAKQLIDEAIAMGDVTSSILNTLAAVEAANGNFEVAKKTQDEAIKLVEATSPVKSDETKTEYKTRMAMYEEGVPYQQGQDDQLDR